MRKPSLRRGTLRSLLRLKPFSTAAAQPTDSPPSPAHSEGKMLTSFSASTETLVPTSSRGSVSASPMATGTRTESKEGATGTVGAGSMVAVYVGQAPVGYRKTGLAGALAGAAGVFIV